MLVALHDLLGVDDRQRKHGGISNDSAFFDNCHCAHEDLVAPLNEIFVGGVHDVAFQMNFVDVIQKVCPSQMAVVLLLGVRVPQGFPMMFYGRKQMVQFTPTTRLLTFL